MRGVSATPIVLVIVIMITGFMSLHLMRMDQWVAASITQEAEVHKPQINAIKATILTLSGGQNTTGGSSQYIYSSAISAAINKETTSDLQGYLYGIPGVRNVIINDNDIYVEHETITLNNIEGNIIYTTVKGTEYIDYPFKKLTDAYNSYNPPSGIRCDRVGGAVSNDLNSKYPDIVWNIDVYSGHGYDDASGCCEWGTACDEKGCWTVCKRSWSCVICVRDYTIRFYTNNATGLSAIYPHQINKDKIANCNERICSCGFSPGC